MPNGDRCSTAKMRRCPANQVLEQCLVIEFGVGRPAFFGDGRAVRVLGGHAWRQADAIDLPFEQQGGLLLVHDGVTRELDARGTRVDDQNEVFHGGHPGAGAAGAPWRRACARKTATAADAIRVRRLSARLVNMMGIRAPSTMPAASAFDM